MRTRRDFLKTSGGLLLGCFLAPPALFTDRIDRIGVNLYSVRDPMLADAKRTLEALAKIGYKEIESAPSVKGNYYGLQPKEIKQVSKDLGLTLRSGHIRMGEGWEKQVDEAAEAGQQYIIAAGLPGQGNTADRYKQAAEQFNQAGEISKKAGLTFGYHNGASDFTKVQGQTLYELLLTNTDPELVKMELDLGWLIVGGADPLYYFEKYPRRFPLWHIKDIKKEKAESTEFGKGRIDIAGLLKNKDKSEMQYLFVEQEEWEASPLLSMQYNYNYLAHLNY